MEGTQYLDQQAKYGRSTKTYIKISKFNLLLSTAELFSKNLGLVREPKLLRLTGHLNNKIEKIVFKLAYVVIVNTFKETREWFIFKTINNLCT